MMHFLLTALLALIVNISFAQKNDDLIYWTASRKLTWDDYRAQPKQGADAAASTATYLGIEYNFGKDGFDYKITCSFSKTRSWALHKNDYILAHEQGHFDIAEIFARRLHKKMQEYVFNKKTFKEDLKKIYMDLMSEKDAFQNDYDEETNHSIHREKQRHWLQKINEELLALKDYADY
jgi:hypothetical protein